MRLASFIRNNLEPLLLDWAEYASTRLPIARDLEQKALRDSAAELLEAIASDMLSEQTAAEQSAKSKGMRPHDAPVVTAVSQRHAATRLTQGFTLDQMASEYRALRASVMRHWSAAKANNPEFEELVRFNEAMDQSLVEAVAWYGARIEHARELFLGVLSHDLRNPLGAIVMGAQVLRMDKTLIGPSAQAATRLQGAGERMALMINDLLDFTRTRLGTRLPIEMTRLQLGPALRQTIEELRSLHPGVTISFECEEDLQGDWDAARLNQLLSNLVGNAIQHGEPGKPVEVAACRRGTQVVLTVHNEGPPITPELIGRIFDPLARGVVQEAERRNGQASLGLGLYISREITQAHGGKIEVASSQAEGTTFKIVLPLSHDRAAIEDAANGRKRIR